MMADRTGIHSTEMHEIPEVIIEVTARPCPVPRCPDDGPPFRAEWFVTEDSPRASVLGLFLHNMGHTVVFRGSRCTERAYRDSRFGTDPDSTYGLGRRVAERGKSVGDRRRTMGRPCRPARSCGQPAACSSGALNPPAESSYA